MQNLVDEVVEENKTREVQESQEALQRQFVRQPVYVDAKLEMAKVNFLRKPYYCLHE